MTTLRRLAWDNLPFMLGFALLAVFCSQRHAGFMMVLTALPVLLYCLTRLGIGWRSTDQRRHYLFAIAVVLAASAVVGAAHGYHHFSARAEADQLLRRVLDFRAQQGRFPGNAAELGEPAPPVRSKNMLHYSFQDGEPALFYAATFIVFDTWLYDFSTQAWVYRPD